MDVWREHIKPTIKSPIFWQRLSPTLLILAVVFIVRDATAASALAAGEIFRALAALAWPALFLAAGWYYRRELRILMARVKKASATGVELSEVVSAQATLQPIAEALKDVEPDSAVDILVSQMASNIRQVLDRIEPDNHARRETRLIAELSRGNITLFFLRTHLTIFLSQMEALERALQIGRRIDLMPFYNTHEHRYELERSRDREPITAYNFDSWCSYLINRRLMTVSDQYGEITDEGAKFVRYITQQNLPRLYSF